MEKEFKGDISSIERYCNLCEVADYFHLNKVEYESEDLFNGVVNQLAKVLKKSWEVSCQLLFPDRKVVVDIFEDYNTTRITLYTIF